MPAGTPPVRPVGPVRSAVVFGFGLIALCGLVATGFAFTRPLVTQSTTTFPYTQVGRLTYHATVSPSSVYGTTLVRTGQPVYSAVVNSLVVNYSYDFQSGTPAVVSGTQQLVATVSNDQGISRAVPLERVTDFKGGHFDASGALNLATLAAVVQTFVAVGGETSGGVYAVNITPTVKIDGHLGAETITTSFNTPVHFTYSSSALLPVAVDSASTSSTSPSSAQLERDFTATASGSVGEPSVKPTVLFHHVTVRNARSGALAISLVALLLGGLFGWRMFRDANSDDERIQIAARYHSLLVEADALPDEGVAIVEVSSITDLVQVAHHLECPVLHQSGAKSAHRRPIGDHAQSRGRDIYAVLDNGTLYRYMSPSPQHVKTGTN